MDNRRSSQAGDTLVPRTFWVRFVKHAARDGTAHDHVYVGAPWACYQPPVPSICSGPYLLGVGFSTQSNDVALGQ